MESSIRFLALTLSVSERHSLFHLHDFDDELVSFCEIFLSSFTFADTEFMKAMANALTDFPEVNQATPLITLFQVRIPVMPPFRPLLLPYLFLAILLFCCRNPFMSHLSLPLSFLSFFVSFFSPRI